jgi:transmembrane sensor
MNKKELISLVRSYLNGKASVEEHAFVEAWYREMDSSRPIETILTTSEMEQLDQKIFANIQARIRVTPQTTQKITPQTAPQPVFAESPVRSLPARRRLPASVRYIAAAVLIFLISGSYILYRHISRNEPEYATLYTQPGKVSRVTLGDGTIIWLNAASHLKFPKTFAKSGPREVFLEGEAYFEVAKDMQHPFLVHTRDLTTKVLGTKFNVKAYTGLPGIEVTLLEGKVMLSAPSASDRKEDTLYLDPNQKGFFAANGLHVADDHLAVNDRSTAPASHTAATHTTNSTASVLFRQAVADAGDDAAWINGQLVFHNATLVSVMGTLDRKYNINIQSDSTLLTQHVTATIDANRTPEEALVEVTSQLKRTTNKKIHHLDGDHAQYRKEGNIYYIE